MAKQLHMLDKATADQVYTTLKARAQVNTSIREMAKDKWKGMLISMGINDVLAEKDIIGTKERPTPWWMSKSDQQTYNVGVRRAKDMLVPYKSIFPNVRQVLNQF